MKKPNHLVAIVLIALALLNISTNAHAIRKATPADNGKLRTEQSVALGSFIGFTIGGVVAPWPFSIASEAAAFGNEVWLYHIPPQFRVPGDASFFPNRNLPSQSDTSVCAYRVINLPYEDTVQRIFGFQLDAFDDQYFSSKKGLNVFSTTTDGYGNIPDWGQELSVYHPHSTVRIQAHNSLLNSNEDYAYFPEGRHNIDWRAETRINPIFDLALPAALIAASGYARFKIANKLKAKNLAKIGSKEIAKYGSVEAAELAAKKQATSNAKNIVKVAKWAAKLGIYKARQNESLADFIDRTSFSGARNSDMQTLTVWDGNLPWFKDEYDKSSRWGQRVWEQDITLEATDFGGVKLNRVVDYLQDQFSVVDGCEILPVSLQNDRPQLFKTGEVSTVTWQSSDDGPLALRGVWQINTIA